ncbi:hypothetical protein BCY86_06700 [Pajaroellobacter abortibovis]|uniref:Uncharacterized protein n=1 Tax=Pajaroellobacter abortibovis TaxID=1882918 RepID=A0A1L6MXS7_9BACT|nr:hypothetical protein BCY86_06700 [Pajaroellobacter abortibovis]
MFLRSFFVYRGVHLFLSPYRDLLLVAGSWWVGESCYQQCVFWETDLILRFLIRGDHPKSEQ